MDGWLWYQPPSTTTAVRRTVQPVATPVGAYYYAATPARPTPAPARRPGGGSNSGVHDLAEDDSLLFWFISQPRAQSAPTSSGAAGL